MHVLKSWPRLIVATILCLGVARAAPINAPEPQRSFASAEEAVSAFVAALRNNQEGDLRAILGPEADRLLDSGDRYADRELHQRFVALYDEKHAIDQSGSGRAELEVGPDDWPMPIPLVERDGRWTFDAKAGAQTIIDRRIGRNELSAIRDAARQRRCPARLFRSCQAGNWQWRICHAPGQLARASRRTLLARGTGRARKPTWATDRRSTGRGISWRTDRWQADPLRRLLFPQPQGARPKRGWGYQELYAVRPDGRRLCVHRVASDIRVEWNHDVHRGAGRRPISKRPWAGDSAHRRGNDDLRPRPHVVTCGNDERLTASATSTVSPRHSRFAS